VQLRYSFRLYPSPGQQQALARAFGCARVVFNDALAARRTAHQAGLPYPTDAELSVRLTAAKATQERAWLGEVSAVVLQQALADLNAAYRNFFASLKGDRKGRRPGCPGSGLARTGGRPSGSPATPGSRSPPAASCGCPRSGTCRCAGRGGCRACRRR
jgi:putative transposase